MKFTKMHGLGNDYVYVDLFTERVDDPAALARMVSDRHTGIGSDGLILISPTDRAEVRMEMFNVDGSRAQMCGNGIRCVAKYAVEHSLAPGPTVRIDTDDGVKLATCEMVGSNVLAVRVAMGKPSFDPAALPATIAVERFVDHPLEIGGQVYRVTCVSMGNPHSVVFLDSLDDFDILRVGPLFENAPVFPERINAHFVRVDARDHVTMKTWERGSGATRACGTGASAVCAAAIVTGKTHRSITASLPGGDLQLEWPGDDDEVYMTGPAVEVFSGEWP